MTPIPLHLIYSLHIIVRWTHRWILGFCLNPITGHSLPDFGKRLTGLHYLEAALSGTFARAVQDKNVID